jgi:hypothetical protein
MDLLVQANMDVNSWRFTAEGRAVEYPKANPDYCYDWSFGSEDEGFVLCVWCDLLDDSGQNVCYRENMQQHARDLERAARNKGLDQEKRSRVQQQSRRARAFDDALDFSYRKGRPVRVILTAGNLRSRDEIVEKSSKVALRTLDDASWYIHRYSRDTGECLLVRNVSPDFEPLTGPQETDDLDNSPGADDDRRMGEVVRRRGQSEFRLSLLAAYSRCCALTGSAVVELLEAAHIVPHSEGRNYSVTNGLLLRADIHTLFDLYLLSIDMRGQIHVSKTLISSEYWQYHGKQMSKMPDRFRDQPHAVSLQSRHERFLVRERSRL